MENERLAVDCFVDFVQAVKAQTSPVFRIRTVNVSDSRCQKINTSVSHCFTLFRICKFAGTDHTVLFTTDAADFTLNGNTFCVCFRNNFFGFFQVFVKR